MENVNEDKVFGFPIKTFTDKNMRKKMMEAQEGTMFLIGENRYKFPEGEDQIELVWARIIKTRD